MNVLGRIFINARKDRLKDNRRTDGVFFVRCRRTLVLNIAVYKKLSAPILKTLISLGYVIS